MNRKIQKTKRYAKRKLKNNRLELMKDSVKKANLERNLISIIGDLSNYKSTTTNELYKISCISYSECSSELFEWMMTLLEQNMFELYNDCDWGWNEEDKRNEMSQKNSRFVIVTREVNGEPVAFSHFRFDMDNGANVLYCYELQLVKSVHKQGLGKHLMNILEKLCSSCGMKKVVLTVFNHNKNAFDFFNSQGYELDETSPQNCSFNTFYSILSKYNEEYSMVNGLVK